jgi:UDP-3-O-[3-hydroxymyristoyl] N-acetylglucosamine deacetylase
MGRPSGDPEGITLGMSLKGRRGAGRDMAAQLTLAGPVEIAGVGLHTGEPCAVTLLPCDGPYGIMFLLGADGEVRVPATVEQVVSSERYTALGTGEHQVRTVEHLLAALTAMGVCHARVRVRGPEIPAMDGSALPFAEAIEQAQTRPLEAPEPPRLRSPVRVAAEGAHIRAAPAGALRVTCTVEYPYVGEQTATFEITPQVFKREIAPARTFGFEHEVSALLAGGLAAGASEENAVVVGPAGYSSPLRFEDELVRHKILDLLGDLALVGVPFTAEIVAVRPGHALNAELARALRAQLAGPRLGP